MIGMRSGGTMVAGPVRLVRAIKVQSFTAASEAALAAAISSWAAAAENRSFVQLDYVAVSGTYSAFLTYTE